MNVIEFADINVKLNEKGKPWRLSDYQRQVLTLGYQRHYSIRLWSEAKKSGKTFLAAIITLWEAITNPDSEIVCCANDEEQAISRVFQTVSQLIKYNPELAASATVQATMVKFTNGSVIRAVSSDYKGQAGGRQRLTIFDELWGYSQERAVRLFEEMTPPPTEKGAYLLIVSYAGFTGEGQLLESLYNRGIAGRRIHKSLECYRAQGLFMFWSHKRRQPWQQGTEGRAYYAEQKRILRPNTFARLHRNEWVSAESQFISAEQWGACENHMLTPLLPSKKTPLIVGVDIGVKNDNAAVVAVCREGDKVRVCFHRVWRPRPREPVQLAGVQEFIQQACCDYYVSKVYFDPSQAFSMMQSLSNAGVPIAEFPQTQKNTTAMATELFNIIISKNLRAYHDKTLRQHILNATAVESPAGLRLAKTTGARKIDLAAALSIAIVNVLQTTTIDVAGMKLVGTRISTSSGSPWEDSTNYDHPIDRITDRARWNSKFWD